MSYRGSWLLLHCVADPKRLSRPSKGSQPGLLINSVRRFRTLISSTTIRLLAPTTPQAADKPVAVTALKQ